MKKLKKKVLVLQDGRLVIDDLPVRQGQQVEVAISIDKPSPPTYPLRGTPVRYVDPFLPAIDDSEWESSR